MSSRKELLKKSLGITEYPWSSDDDLEEPSTSTAPDASAFRHSDPRPPATDMPGPSGLQSSQSTQGTRRQAKYDRDLFWSILNSPCNPIKTGPPPPPLPSPISGSRQSRLEATIPGRLMHAPAADHHRSIRASNVPDIQRILAFKRLTRNINGLRHHRATCPVSLRSNSLSSLPSDTSGVRSNRGQHHFAMRRFQPTRSVLSVYRNASANMAPSHDLSNSNTEEPIALTTRSRHRAREIAAGDAERRSPASPVSPVPAPAPQIQVNINIHNDDEEADNSGPTESQSILPDEVNLIQDEPSDVEILGNNTSTMSLEEEIVEIDADDAVSLPGPAPAPPAAPIDLEDDMHEHSRDPNLASTSSRAVEPTTVPSKQGVKRKRQDSDDSLEPYTVKEFNQELLRLLECPVCLEWMEPPMTQCRRGHLVCGRCRARLNACPVCRTTFSSVRNRAMEGVAEMLRYPCRHGCGREVRLRRRGPHEASCALRKYQCPAPACCQHACMPRQMLAEHFQEFPLPENAAQRSQPEENFTATIYLENAAQRSQPEENFTATIYLGECNIISKHLSMLKIGGHHNFSIKMSAEQHDNWIILAMDEYFHLRIDVDIRVFVYVAFIGPKCDAKNFIYEVTVEGQHHSRKLVYARSTHCDLESPSVNVSREDCFSLSLDQALNFIRFKNRRCDSDKYLEFNVEITKVESAKDDSDS